MDLILNDGEIRVLGALMEKEVTTPEYYPLSINSLTNACNQKSNRSPVVSFDEEIVVSALDGLKKMNLAVQSNVGRVPKYSQIFGNKYNLIASELALLCILFLRGPQTIGELRGRTERMYPFDGLDAVKERLDIMAEGGYVINLPRQPGTKENRYTHLLAGEPDLSEATSASPPEKATHILRYGNDRMQALELEVAELKAEIKALKTDFASFKNEFE